MKVQKDFNQENASATYKIGTAIGAVIVLGALILIITALAKIFWWLVG